MSCLILEGFLLKLEVPIKVFNLVVVVVSKYLFRIKTCISTMAVLHHGPEKDKIIQ